MAALERTLPLERSSVQSAHELIKPYVHLTPVVTSTTLSTLASTPQAPEALTGTPYEGRTPAKPRIKFFFKCENFQRIGAFKARGAFHALLRLSEEERARGVVTTSSGGNCRNPPKFCKFDRNGSGNHAQALALAARTFGIPAHVVMPAISTPSKIEATKGYGAEVVFSGSTSQERDAVAAQVKKRTGAIYIPPDFHPDIILGQGTAALELEEQVRDLVTKDGSLSVHEHSSLHGNGQSLTAGLLDAVLTPLGGGGLLSGVATALSGTGTLVFGAEPSFDGADDGRRSLVSGEHITHVQSLTIADGLRTHVKDIPWSVIRDKKKVHGVYAVSEEQILQTMRLVLERMKIFVEPSAVVGLAVCLFDEDFRALVEKEGGKEGWDVGIVLSGGNTSVEAITRMFAAPTQVT